MSIDKDKLYPRATMQREYPDLDAAVASGQVCQRKQWGVEEFWVNSRPEQNATIFTAPRLRTDAKMPAVPAPSVAPTQQRPAPVKKASRPAEVGPLGF